MAGKEKTVDDWLNKACEYENKGQTKFAEMALRKALKLEAQQQK